MHTTHPNLRRPVLGVRGMAVLVLAVLAVAACSDPFSVKAQYANVPFTYSLYGISGSGPANAPAALDLANVATVRVDGSFGFDVAFDFDGTGKIRILPQKLVGASISGARTVGLQRLSGVYETVLLAPARGWVFDSLLTVLPGEVVGVRLTAASCAYQLSTEIYAKFVVDSVRAGGLIFGRGVMNPNCGFKSFDVGIPTK
jgi:hypothetical protein